MVFVTMLSVLLAVAFSSVPESDHFIWAGRFLDGQTERVRTEVTIRVRGDKIIAIDNGYVKEASSSVVDLRKMTVLPGLIDAHTHITSQSSPKSYSERFFMEPTDFALRSTLYAKRTLLAGFTTIRDLGDRYNASISLRDAINKGWVKGPRIFTSAKALASTGGHADPSNGIASPFSFDPTPTDGVLNGVADARKAVRQRYKDGADLIKITATGGVLSLAASGQNPQFFNDELEAIVNTARDYGLKVAVHAHGTEGVKRALRAGVHSIEHGTYMDKEAMKLFKKKGTYYVPTILAGRFVAEKAKVKGYFPEVVRPKAARIGALIAETFAKAYRAGVPIAFGTDSGVSAHGENAKEFIYMVEAGMKPIEAILSSTLHAAKLIGEDRIGAIKPGAYADIIAVKDDPRTDIRTLLDVRFVMKGGVIYKHHSK